MTANNNTMKQIYNIFQKAVMIFFTACFIWTGAGTISLISTVHIGSSRYNGSIFFLAIFLLVLLLLLLYRAFLWIKLHPDDRTQNIISGVLFGIMAVLFLVMLTGFDANLRNDAYQDADTACYLTDHDHVPVDNKHPGELLSFGNNYFFIFMTSRIIQVLFALGITEPVIYLQTINAVFMMAGAFFTWLLARELSGRVFANQVLLMCVFNPLFYGFTFWYYSNSLSIPIMMAIPFVCLKLYKSRTLYMRLIWGAVLGMLLFLGYQLRPTAVFPFIAVCMIAPFVLHRNHPEGMPIKDTLKALAPAAAITAACAVILFSAFSHTRSSYFGELIPHNRPITYWLAMGAHGTGNLETNGSDIKYVKSLSDNDDKMMLCLKRALNHYRKNGITGTMDLWARKTQTTWSDGYGGISRRMNSGEAKSPLYGLLAGENKDFFILYCQLFRLITAAGIIAFSIHYFARPMGSLMFVCVVTMLGGIVFYFLWEARAFYAAPFVPVMLIMAGEGFGHLFERLPEPFCDADSKKPAYPVIICWILISLFVSADMMVITSQSMSMDHYRIYTKGKQRHYASLEDGGRPVLEIAQDFYVYNSFNQISCAARLKNDARNVSEYQVSITDEKGDIYYSEAVSDRSIHSNKLKFVLPGAAPAGKYSLMIKKLSPAKDDITFLKKYDSYYIDAYRGELAVNGHKGYVNDLGLSVLLHTEKEPYLTKKIRLAAAFILLMMSLAVLIPICKKDLRFRGRS